MDGAIANQHVQTDLRDFLAAVEEGGELKKVAGAHWDKEMGTLAEMFCTRKGLETPTLMFENIPGIKEGYRVMFHELSTPWAVALTMCFPP